MDKLLEVKNLKKYFPIKGGILRRTVGQLKAVDGVSFTIGSSQTMGLVGESGCGKSALGRAILRLYEPTEGQMFLEGVEFTKIPLWQMEDYRRKMQIIFQDPNASLNPRMTVRDIIQEPLNVHKIGIKEKRAKQAEELVEIVGLRKESLSRYPHEFSGGQRQRVGIARALALNPKFIIADEAVSALDVSVQSQVLNLIAELQEKFGISFLFISHDLAVINHVSHTVGVMYLGKIVEKASTKNLYQTPKHPYTQALLSAIPIPEPEKNRTKIVLEGDVPSPLNPPSGCTFHPRCPQALDICKVNFPQQTNLGTTADEHLVSCHLYS